MPRDLDPADLLLSKARDDLSVAAALIKSGDVPTEIVGFHAQQCCEKAMKAVLARRGVRYPFSHDLLALVDLLLDNGIDVPDVIEQVPILTPFAVVYRYEDLDLGDAPDPDDLLHLARRMCSWAADSIHAE